MQTHTIDNELIDLHLLQNLAQAYARIAAVRMQKTRATVLHTRDFLSALADVFYEVLRSYRHEIERMQRRTRFLRGKDVTFLPHNGRTVAVLLSANVGLYGAVIRDVFDMFLDEIADPSVEATIIGRVGRSMFEELYPNRPYTYFDVPDYQGEDEEMSIAKLMNHLVQYEVIHVYHGKFFSFINQKAVKFAISANPDLVDQSQKNRQTFSKYVFEPDMETILQFFESAIFSSLFSQSLSESQLAKLASRAYAMNHAEDTIKDTIGKKNLERLKLIHRIRNRKQLSLVTRMYGRRG